MLLELARSKRIFFFGGKGGVGKTTVSAATALAMAMEGKRVLLISTDPAHNLGHLFNREIGPRPVRLAPNLDGMELDPQLTVNEHLDEVSGSLRKLMAPHLAGEVDKHIELSRDAPGMQEAAIMERIAEVVEQGARDYDMLVFDTAPSGHTARLIALPEMMSAWTDGLIQRRDKAERFSSVLRNMGSDRSMGNTVFGGPTDPLVERESTIRSLLNRRKRRFSDLRSALSDAERTSFIIVLAAERLPVLETIELHDQLRRTGVKVGGLIVNKRLPDGLGDFLTERRTQEEVHLATLKEALPELPRQDLTLVAHDVVGLEALERFAKSLK
ncbi:MAG: ArsA family ATPase [Gammaproteobacteria bacterium]|nr:ArsA family ATPase [Gammaproteobacteria bacterium]MDP2141868.1 ArsA family ATPase [Gammaproteobacteria bacterium]MDP2348181.1 ArsA family ATPase [Gammaproteobacteria bacterium]